MSKSLGLSLEFLKKMYSIENEDGSVMDYHMMKRKQLQQIIEIWEAYECHITCLKGTVEELQSQLR